jgi:hypothetical protein
MNCPNPKCLVNYNFDHIASFAIKRFVEGHDTIDLMQCARTDREKEEIALVSMLDMDDDNIRELKLCCKHAKSCKSLACRERLRQVVETALITQQPRRLAR